MVGVSETNLKGNHFKSIAKGGFDRAAFEFYNEREKSIFSGELCLIERHLKIGRIHYTNLFPIFYMLEKTGDVSAYDFIESVPSTLNRLLRDGEIDISPSSSVEYLRNEDKYTLLEGHSISSFGPVGSILLFSIRPIETLDGLTLLTTSQSETSVALLQIILKKFYRITCPLKSTDEPLSEGLESFPAYLLIGDDALIAKKTVTNGSLLIPGKDQNARLGKFCLEPNASPVATHASRITIYDLGDIWQRNTHFPFVFALWIARKECCTAKLVFERFKNDLAFAKIQALKDLRTIARESPLRAMLSEDEIVSYWQGISYDLTREHKKGLELFRKYAGELKLI
ncbi:MAG TPA: futalosine synthase [Nitrospiraceae bacterium]|nr:futalosine synthase [Nitrospiraceae bacterium]